MPMRTITPMELRQANFSTALRGYDKKEVRLFLELVAEELGKLAQEYQRMKEDFETTKKRLSELQDREKTVKDTLVTVQKISEDLKTSARKEAELVVSQAELTAEKILNDAHSRVIKIFDQINDLRGQRTQFLATLRNLIDTYQHLLEASEQEAKAVDDVESKISMFPPTKA